MKNIPELVCPAGNLPALKTAVDNGADTVYMGLKDATNARNFPGLNFDQKSIIEGIRYAHDRGRQVLMAINTYAQAGQVERWRRAVDTAADLGADAVIVADPAVMAYACEKHPNLRLHMSVQGSATNYEAINLMKDLFGIRRAVLPRVLTIDQVQHVIENTDVEIEVFGFGSLCVMVEGRQRSPMYTAQVTRTLRQALDAAAADPAHYRVTPAWDAALGKVSEGSQSTLGAYNRPWK